MSLAQSHSNPFILLVDPQSVLAQIERSERLEGLNRRICRPLDRLQPIAGAAVEGEPAEVDGEGALPTGEVEPHGAELIAS